jgi:hypothetical protein
VGVFTLVVFPTVACFFDRGERHKDRVLTHFFSTKDSFFAYGSSQHCPGYKLFVEMFLFLGFSAVASYKQVFIVYTWVFPKVAIL